MDISNPQTWKEGMRLVLSAPYVVVPLLIAVAWAAWWSRGAVERGLRNGLQGRLDLAKDQHDYLSGKLSDAFREIDRLKFQLEHNQFPAALESATHTASILGDLKSANTELGHTLTPQSGIYRITGHDAKLTVTRKDGTTESR